MRCVLNRSHIAADAVLAILIECRALHQSNGVADDDLTAWDSLEELRPPAKMAAGAVVRPEMPLHTQKAPRPSPCNPIITLAIIITSIIISTLQPHHPIITSLPLC